MDLAVRRKSSARVSEAICFQGTRVFRLPNTVQGAPPRFPSLHSHCSCNGVWSLDLSSRSTQLQTGPRMLHGSHSSNRQSILLGVVLDFLTTPEFATKRMRTRTSKDAENVSCWFHRIRDEFLQFTGVFGTLVPQIPSRSLLHFLSFSLYGTLTGVWWMFIIFQMSF